LATERLTAVHPHAVAGTSDRNAIDVIVPVYKSVHLTTRCLNSLAEQIQEIASSNPRLIDINDSPGEPDVHRMLKSLEHKTRTRPHMAENSMRGPIRIQG
jgi:hypothetical protein